MEIITSKASMSPTPSALETIGTRTLHSLAARHGTPLYVYSADILRGNYQHLESAFAVAPVTIAYSVKANSNLTILRFLAGLGASFDIVSGGELERVRRAGVSGDRIIFAGVGKRADELRAALLYGVREINLESEQEAERLDAIAGSLGTVATVAIRVNPDVSAKTHSYIATGTHDNKFGMSIPEARRLARRIGRNLRHLRLEGLHAHIGSQILEPGSHLRAMEVLGDCVRNFRSEDGADLRTLNLGGGFGIDYHGTGERFDPQPLGVAMLKIARSLGLDLIVEPGRSIVASAGLLLTKVEYLKKTAERNFAIVDASMTELIRPALYEAHHRIVPLQPRAGREVYDVVGPVCESGDFLGLEREMPRLEQGDLLAVLDAGAYGMAMASNYNSRPRPAEILVDGHSTRVIRRRESVEELFKNEV